MKYKLKEINLDDVSFNKIDVTNGKIVNLKYKNDSLEFQTPKIIIEDLIKENNQEFIILKILGNQACKLFCSRIIEFENLFNTILQKNKDWFHGSPSEIKTIFNEHLFIVKIPFKYSRPLVKVYKDNSLFNYYHLSKGMEIICLITLDKLWINTINEPSYNLNVKEIMVL
jgi:hypothetical protein